MIHAHEQFSKKKRGGLHYLLVLEIAVCLVTILEVGSLITYDPSHWLSSLTLFVKEFITFICD